MVIVFLESGRYCTWAYTLYSRATCEAFRLACKTPFNLRFSIWQTNVQRRGPLTVIGHWMLVSGKFGRLASEEVTLQLIKKVNACQYYFMDYINRMLFNFTIQGRRWVSRLRAHTIPNKTFRSANIDVINDCRLNFNFLLPSDMIENRRAKFQRS